MRLNADFSQPVIVIPSADAWVRSPESGVDRLMLDRVGNEVARATSIVRYAAGSRFARHVHDKGEEFLVLDGVFSDESGDYPQGFYVRNPPGSGHAPHSDEGCRILVKLRQFEAGDSRQCAVDTVNTDDWRPLSNGNGAILPLHEFGSESVCMLQLSGGESLPLSAYAGGLELFVLDGTLRAGQSVLPAECWLRLPAGSNATVVALRDARLWAKTGHLPRAPAVPG
ncbi:MAG: cupin domain-containing protein [Gammaproteobacteria bacterium]|nr:cupin domain-containing protein [Gammaproteobacteria bacterium]